MIQLFAIFVVGTAGSGKSLFTGSFLEWLKAKDQNAITVNLDPGASYTPYNPDVDVRTTIDIYEIMNDHKLGPNGALVMAADQVASELDSVQQQIDELNPDYAIIDTSGQMELFAFRASGPYIAKEIVADQKIVLYMFDSIFSNSPFNYVSNMFLAAAVNNRFNLPQIHVLSKTDILPPDKVKEILDWSSRSGKLEMALENSGEATRLLLNRDVLRALGRLNLTFSLLPISSPTNAGFTDLFALLQRIFMGGEEIVKG